MLSSDERLQKVEMGQELAEGRGRDDPAVTTSRFFCQGLSLEGIHQKPDGKGG